MTNFQELITHSMIKPHHTIKKLCRPLEEYLRIAKFGQMRIYQDGRYGHLTSCPDLVEFFYENKLFVNHPYFFRNPLLFEGGTALVTLTQENCFRKKFKDLFLTDQMCVILKTFEDYSDCFVFAPENLAARDCHILFNQLHLLEKFANYFKRETRMLMHQSVEVGVNMKNELKEQFDISDPSFPLYRKDLKNAAFLKSIFPLTPREHACLRLFKKGHSAQATGAILKISQRTVEHHFENIKEKLRCHSKWELLDL